MITTNGVKQATYDGHPLYTYVGDTAPGQVKGNALNVSGGLWWVMTPSGSKVAAASSSAGSSPVAAAPVAAAPVAAVPAAGATGTDAAHVCLERLT